MNDQTHNSTETADDAPSAIEERFADEAPSSRRGALRTLGKLGVGAAALSLATFGPRPRKALAENIAAERTARAAGGRLAQPILNFALTLEYLEMFFYQEGTGSIGDGGSVIEGDEAQTAFGLIQEHEEKHVDYLTGVINSLGEGPDPVEFTRDDFDFTAGGNFDPFNNYAQFLLLAQGFEDTGVRAYKGQAPAIMGTPYLEPALQIHALEARHAAQVRTLRADQQGADVEPWIVLGSVPDDSPIAAVYGPSIDDDEGNNAGFPPEENITQAGIDLTTLGDYSEEDASAAFDEPLDMTTVNAIAGPFITPSMTLDFSSSNAPFGVLNYAYALEQLEAAFYGRAMQESSFDDETMDVLNDLWDHERAHREFFEAKITQLGGEPLGALTLDFSSVDFSDRNSVLTTALTFEDLGVSAYNGAASLIETANPLMAAGDIVSVEARHAAAIRDLMEPSDNYFGGTFALDGEYVINDQGLDEARSPSEVLPAAQPFIANTINVEGLGS
jgi:rubrerythrin